MTGTWWSAPEWERRPLVFVEDQLYHTGDLLAVVSTHTPHLLSQTTVVALDRPGPDTDAIVADWQRLYPDLQVAASIERAAPRRRQISEADLADAGAYARLIAGMLRPGGLFVQDVHLSTVTCVPADRWWESIYLAATVRGMFATRPPAVRFLSNKRGYAATFGRDLLNAGFDPRDVMDKSELTATVLPTVTTLMAQLFPLVLDLHVPGRGLVRWPVANHDEERQSLEAALDLLLWPTPQGVELSGRIVRGRVPLRARSPEALTWTALMTDANAGRQGLPVLEVGTRLGGDGVERAEATNLAARHIHTMRSRLTHSAALATLDHAYRLADGLTAGIVSLPSPSD